ncbi:MAG: DUF5076 domain-containing protein [Ketobacter sp.]|uniref:DUF5076 domain-containing protein n=1 Tax=Ketobacter sp. MCCC 1A13808 TaxID=2602738 RepID=UPI0018DE3084|nr:DUF5076 domain-containing protein [Ketobacter sp. MCCC 1A13808]
MSDTPPEIPKTLPIPTEVQNADAHELVRVWDVEGKQHVSISSGLGGDAKQFGQLLAQIALHSSQVYEKNERIDRASCLRQILMGFKEEVAKEVTRAPR